MGGRLPIYPWGGQPALEIVRLALKSGRRVRIETALGGDLSALAGELTGFLGVRVEED